MNLHKRLIGRKVMVILGDYKGGGRLIVGQEGAYENETDTCLCAASKSAQERFETGAVGVKDAMIYRGPRRSDAAGLVGGFLLNLFSDMEFFAGLTPGYIAGASEKPGRTSWSVSRPYWEDSWVEKRQAFSLTLDAGMTLNYSLWRFDLKLTPAFHYNLMNNYLYHIDSGENGPDVLKSTTTPIRWFFTLCGGLAFRF